MQRTNDQGQINTPVGCGQIPGLNKCTPWTKFVWNSCHCLQGLLMYFSSSSRHHYVTSPRNIKKKATKHHPGSNIYTNIINSFEQFLWNSDHSVQGLLMYFSSSSRQWVHCVRSPRDIEEKATHQGDEAKPEVILIIIIFWEAAAKLCRKLPTLLDITSSPSPLESAMEAKLQGDQIIQDLYFKLATFRVDLNDR